MLKLLINSLASEFYQQHAGFFLVGIYILFGVVEPSQLIDYQKALLLAGISSPVGLAIVFSAWLLYSLKAYFFIRQKLALTKYSFVRETATLGKNNQIKLWLKLFTVILLPVIIYVLLLVGLSVHYQLLWSALSIIVVFPVLLFMLSWFVCQSLTFGFLKQERKPINFGVKIKRPFFSWPIFHLLSEQPLMLLMCKGLSFVFFKGILWMFADVANDSRVLLISLLASVLCHAVLLSSLLKFELEYLNFNKSLPLSVYRRILNWFLIFAIILIPEWIFVIMVTHTALYTIMNAFLFGLAGLFFMLISLYLVKLDMDKYLKWLLFFFFVAMWSVFAHYYIPFSMLLLASCILYYLLMFNKVDLKTLEDD